jgi:transcriptional regulator with XRE-family HTH domain
MHTTIKQAGLSVTEFARVIGVSRIAVHNWVAKRTKPHKLLQPKVKAALEMLQEGIDKGDLPLVETEREVRDAEIEEFKNRLRKRL